MKSQCFIFFALIVVTFGCHSNRPTQKQLESFVHEVTIRRNDLPVAERGSLLPGFGATLRTLNQPYATITQIEQALGAPESKRTRTCDKCQIQQMLILSWIGSDNGKLEATFDRDAGTLIYLDLDTPAALETIGRDPETWRFQDRNR
jgi:hypothetical protein